MHALGVGGGDDHVLGVARAEQADAGSGVGDGDAVVGILVAGAGAFLGEHADDLERHVLDEDVAADRVGAAEQLLAHLVADHRDRGGGVFVALGEVAALGHRPVEDFREVGVVAADVGVVVDVPVAHHQLAAVHRHDLLHLGQGGDGGDVVAADDAHRRARVRRVAAEIDDVRAERAHLRHHLALAALADGEHDHHRGDADDDPEQGQRGAEPIDPHHPPGGAHRLQQFGAPGPRGFAAALGEALAEIVGLQVALDAGARVRRALVVGAVADDLAVTHLDDALGAGGDVAVVGDQDHHVALAGQLVEQRHDFRAAVAVEGAGGFVGENDMAAVHQRAGDRYPLLLAAGQLVRTVGSALCQAQALEQGPRAGVPLARRGAGVDRRHLDVFLGRGGGDQVIALEHEAECLAAQPGLLVAVQFGDVVAGEVVAAGAGPVEAAEDVHQGRLAGAGGADDGDELAGVDRQRYALEYLDFRSAIAAVALADVAQFDQGDGLRGVFHQLSLPSGAAINRRSPSSRPASTCTRRRSLMPVLIWRLCGLPLLPTTQATWPPLPSS